MRPFLLPLFVICISFSANASQTNILQVEPDTEGTRPSWNVAGTRIVMDVVCRVGFKWIWPVRDCATPHLFLMNQSKAILQIGDVELAGERSNFDQDRYFEQGRVLFMQAPQDRDPIVTVSRRAFLGDSAPEQHVAVLMDFHRQANIVSQRRYDWVAPQIDEIRSNVIFLIIGVLVGVPLVGYLSWHALCAARRKVSTMASEATKDRQHRRVRRTAEDEAIRHSTREQLTQANDQEKAVLRNQISEALEKGDTKTAKTLLSLLERLDQERSPTTTTE
jgi:hypothetical protein